MIMAFTLPISNTPSVLKFASFPKNDIISSINSTLLSILEMPVISPVIISLLS
jgi:hypothetical protein